MGCHFLLQGTFLTDTEAMAPAAPAMQEMWVRFLDWDDPLEKEMATHSSILAWKIPRTEEPGGFQSTQSREVGHV